MAYLSEERLVDLHALVGALRQHLPTPVPAVADRRVGVGDAAEEHRPFVVELLLGLTDALVHRHHWVVQVCKEPKEGKKMGIKHVSVLSQNTY